MVAMLLWQVLVALVLFIASGRGTAALPFLRHRRDISAIATSELHLKGGQTVGGTQSRLQGLVRSLNGGSLDGQRQRIVAKQSATGTNATSTSSELLEWANRLRLEESNLTSDIFGMQVDMSSVEGLVSNLTLNVSRVSNALAATLQEVQASTADRRRLDTDTAVIAKPAISELNSTEQEVVNISAMVGLVQLAELHNLSRWMPGGEVAQQIDVAEANLRVYEQDVRASVERTLTANSSLELKTFMDNQRLVLSNLSNITSDETGNCTCPPCNTAGG